jgi:glycosyltransferase involved in cell wall biosynthesis
MTDPIRVLELRSVWGTGGGPEKTILLGTARTDPSRYAITVCYLRDLRDEVFHIDQRAGSLPIDYVEIRERHSFDPGIWKPLRSLIRSRRIDILHAHDYKTDFLALLLAWFEPVVPLSTAHGWAGHSWKEEHVYNPADRRLLARFPRVLVVSADMRDALVRRGAASGRITVVPNGIDDRQFRRDAAREAAARAALGLAPDDVVIGAVGRLQSEKNYPLLIRTFADLALAHPRLRLVIAGDGALRSDLERLVADLGLQGRCRLLGLIPDVIALHHALDLFVICSDNEGSPNAVLEAMALETPIVATDVGGISDLVRHGQEALLVRRRDAAALAAAIRDSLTDRAGAAARARAARERVERDLSFERRMQRVERVYDELMAQYPGIREGRRWWKAWPT